MMQPVERPPSLHQTVQRAIKSYIIDSRLVPGDKLPSEYELAEQLAVSRNVIRESLRGLEALGILEIRRGSGLYVGEFSLRPIIDNLQYSLLFDVHALQEVLAVRRAVETGMIKDAIARRTPTQIEALSKILEAMRAKAEQGDEILLEDRQFHQCLFQNLNNQTLLEILDVFWLTLHQAREKIDLRDQDPLWTYHLHVPIVEAFEAGSIEATQTALEEHHASIEKRLSAIHID